MSYKATNLETGETRLCPFRYGRGMEMALLYASGQRENYSDLPVWDMEWANTVCDEVAVSRRKDLHNGGRTRKGGAL